MGNSVFRGTRQGRSERRLRTMRRERQPGGNALPVSNRKDSAVSDGLGSAESTEGFSVERIARNNAIFREANEQIGETAEEYGAQTSIPFLCECADQNCREIVWLMLEQFREVRSDPRHFVNMPGHEASAHGWAEVIARADGYVTVAKIGRAGDIAETLADDDEPTSVTPARRDA
jgi:hypothetical protein